MHRDLWRVADGLIRAASQVGVAARVAEGLTILPVLGPEAGERTMVATDAEVQRAVKELGKMRRMLAVMMEEDRA